MKISFSAALFLVAITLASPGHAAKTNPIAKVVEMLSGLEAKIIKEGTQAQKLYDEFSEWCEDTSKDLHFEIRTGKQNIADLTATINEESAAIEELNTKIGELAESNAVAEKDLKAATEIRAKEAADFAAEDKELSEAISALERAIAILEREMAGGASFAQLKSAQTVAQALEIMVESSAVSSADAAKLTAMVQTSAQATDSDEDVGAPDPAVYKSQSGSIVDTLSSLLEKAEAQLADARKAETTSKNNYELLKQSLEDQIKFSGQDLDEAKQGVAACSEKKASAEGDLDTTSKDLADDEKNLADLHHECMTKAEAFEEETKTRGEELKALATAKKVIKESTGGAAEQTYSLAQVSLLQVKSRDSSNIGLQAVQAVRRLAITQRSSALAQLASRMQSAIRLGDAAGDDPFAKVKSLITDLLTKLEAEAAADATEKAYCDKEMKETTEKKEDKEAELEKLGTKIAQATAESTKLKDEVATLQKELADLMKAWAEMDKIRSEEAAVYAANKPEMEEGIKGVQLALKVLREYYGQDKAGSAEGSASGIIGLLEVAESDFTKGLAEMVADEERAVADFDAETKENEIVKATKTKDVEYKTGEIAALDKAAAELTSDYDGVKDELDAVLEYLTGIKKRCVAKAETYEERKARRQSELAGLKNALEILSSEAALLQKQSVRRTFRGNLRQHSIA